MNPLRSATRAMDVSFWRKMRRAAWLLSLGMALWLACIGVARAELKVSLERQSISINETFSVIFSVDGQSPGTPDFSPLQKDFDILSSSQQSQFSIVNGTTQSSKSWTLKLAARRTGRLRIPPIASGAQVSKEVFVNVQQQSAQPPASSAGQQSGVDIFVDAEVDTDIPYVQQQVVLTIRVYVPKGKALNNPTLDQPNAKGGDVRIERLGTDSQYSKKIDGHDYRVVELRYAIFPQQSGQLAIPSMAMSAYTTLNSLNLFDPFGGNKGNKRIVKRTKEIQMQVRPVPDSFQGKHWLPAAVLNISEQWSEDPTRLRQGEAVTRSLRVEAQGVLANQIPEISLPNESWFRGYPEQPELKENKEFGGTAAVRIQRLAFIPTSNGEFILPAVRIPWWNIKTDKQEFAELPERRVHVAPGAEAAVVNNADPAMPESKSFGDEDAPKMDWDEDNGEGEVNGTNPQSRGEDGRIWKWSFIASIALWLLSLCVWLFLRHPHFRKTKTEESSQAEQSKGAIERSLKKACNANQAEQVKDLLLQWCQMQWKTGDAPANLGTLAQRVPEGFTRSLQRLNQCLYQQSATGEWQDGMEIWQDFEDLRAELRKTATQRKRQTASALRPLWKG
ncbi:MAG: BatD family protein [Candidatus Eutrophobiaceae bacterium]